MADVGSVTEQDVLRVAELANLDLTAEEVPRMQRDLNAILGHIAQLNELDTSRRSRDGAGGRSGARVADLAGAEAARGRGCGPSLDRKAVMAAAPETDGRFFKVPKVIER